MIGLQISAVNGFIVFVSLTLGYVAFRRTITNHNSIATKGDLAVAITAVAASVLVLGFLFGVGDDAVAPPPTPATSSQNPMAP